jgi:hypothetical protein
MVEPTVRAFVVLMRPAMFIAPAVEKRPWCRVDELILRAKPTVFVTASVLMKVEPVMVKFLVVRVLPTSTSYATASDEKTETDP